VPAEVVEPVEPVEPVDALALAAFVVVEVVPEVPPAPPDEVLASSSAQPATINAPSVSPHHPRCAIMIALRFALRGYTGHATACALCWGLRATARTSYRLSL
jgi:hypothetical protein